MAAAASHKSHLYRRRLPRRGCTRHGRERRLRALKGWRPLGGAIEFGESAREAVLREFVEETGHTIRCVKQLCVLENRYSHEATPGHEIVFVFQAEFVESAGYATSAYTFLDGGVANEVAWMPVHDFKRGAQRLYPEALKEYLDD